MSIFFDLLLALAVGATAGIVAGSILARRRKARHDYTNPAVQRTARFNQSMLRFFKNALYALLAIGIVWTLYFLVLGLVDKAATEYATNASTLIVSVLTLFSILLAYHEFMQRGRPVPKRSLRQGAPPQEEDAPDDRRTL